MTQHSTLHGQTNMSNVIATQLLPAGRFIITDTCSTITKAGAKEVGGGGGFAGWKGTNLSFKGSMEESSPNLLYMSQVCLLKLLK